MFIKFSYFGIDQETDGFSPNLLFGCTGFSVFMLNPVFSLRGKSVFRKGTGNFPGNKLT